MKKIDTCSPLEPIVRLAHRFESLSEKYIYQPMKLSAIGLKILTVTKEHGGKITLSELLKKIETTKSNMSQRLGFLEKEAYIKRKKGNQKDDRRTVIITLTPSGKKRLDTLEKRLTKAHISFEQKLSQKELNQHTAFLKKINHILDTSEEELKKIFHSF